MNYLVCLPQKFDILSTGITPDELAAEKLNLDEVFGAMAEFKTLGQLDETRTSYKFLLNKLVKYIVFDFESPSSQQDAYSMYLLTDAAKCRLAGLLIAEGLCEETASWEDLEVHTSTPDNGGPYSISDMMTALDESIKRNGPPTSS